MNSLPPSFRSCIYCNSGLSPERSGEGEHIIPKNIGGLLRSYDVCPSCMQHFGNKVDGLPLRHPGFVQALENLGKSINRTLGDNLPYVGIDTIDGKEIPMVRKNGEIRVKTDPDGSIFGVPTFPENGLPYTAFSLNQLRLRSKEVPDEVIRQELQRVQTELEKSRPGTTVHSELLDSDFAKKTVTSIRVNEEGVPSMHPLVAKIVAFMCAYSLSAEEQQSIPPLMDVKKYAIGKKKDPNCFVSRIQPETEELRTCHVLQMYKIANNWIFRFSFFSQLDWIAVLPISKPSQQKDGRRLRQVVIVNQTPFSQDESLPPGVYIGFKTYDDPSDGGILLFRLDDLRSSE